MLIAVGLVANLFLGQNSTTFWQHAAPDENPQNITITNITDSSFTVTYLTQTPLLGSIAFDKDKSLKLTALDDRDQVTNIATLHLVHSITVKNLLPNTPYFFSIHSGKSTYLQNNQPFKVITAGTITAPLPVQQAITGNLVLPNSQKPEEAIVYAKTKTSQVLSGLVKPNGFFTIPLSSLKSTALTAFLPLKTTDSLELTAFGDGMQSQVVVDVKDINPLPLITLSQNYDFTSNLTPLASSSAQISSDFGFPDLTSKTPNAVAIKILTPQKNQSFTDQQPLFQGQALPNTKVEIIIHSDAAIDANTTTNSNGLWTYRPAKPLPPGNHMISILTKDSSGIIKTIVQSFTVYAAGSTVNQSATPSATPIVLTSTPSPTVPEVPSSTATVAPTLTPTSTPTPTLTPAPSIEPTISPTGITTAFPKSKSPLPPTGSSFSMIAAVIGGLTTLTGVLILALSQGGSSL